MPLLLALPSPRDVARANLALVQANASLETTIAWRTHEIELTKQRFEQAMARSNTTVFTLDTDLRHTWIYNPRPGSDAEAMLGQPPRRCSRRGRPIAAAQAPRARQRRDRQCHRRGTDRGRWPALPHDRQPHGGSVRRYRRRAWTATDVTEKRLFEIELAAMTAKLAAAYQRFDLALEESPISVFEQDADLRYTYIHNPPGGTLPETFLGRTDAEYLLRA